MASWQEIFVPYVVSIYLLTGEHLGHSVNFKDMSFIDSWCHISTTGDWPGVTNPPQWILYVRSSYVGGVAFSALLFQTSIKKRTPLLIWWIASFAHMIPPIHIPNLDILVSNLTSLCIIIVSYNLLELNKLWPFLESNSGIGILISFVDAE